MKATLTHRKQALARHIIFALGVGAFAPMAFANAPGSGGQDNSGEAAQQTPAADQTNDEDATQLATMVVTGSRIRQVDLETRQPVTVVSRAEIEKMGLVTVGDIISHMTIQGSPSLTRQSVTAASTEQGGSYIDMRNLGRQRVLVLVNGKRWISNSQGATDLSTIPSSVIERIEVLKDGASAVYGSDAVTGVVNIITRRNFSGAQAKAYYGENQEGDGTTEQYDFTIGTAGDNSAVMVSGSHTRQGVMWDAARELTRYSNGPRHPGPNSSISPKGRFKDGDGTWALDNATDDATDFANYHPYKGATGDRYNTRLDTMFRVPSEQTSLYTQGHYDFTDQISFRATAVYSERHSTKQLAGYPLRTSSFRDLDGKISADSIYNPSPLNQDVSFWHRTAEVPRTTKNTTRTTHFDAALEGWFDVGRHEYNWDVGVNWNKSSGLQLRQGNVNLLHASAAIGPSFIDANGTPRCGTPGNMIEGCIPWNVLGAGDPDKLTPELRDYLFVTGQDSYGSKVVSYTANITGGLFDMPHGGEVAFAAGAEHRTMSGYENPDQFSQSGLSTDLSSGPTKGQFQVNEAYGELSIPVLQGVTGAEELTFDLASRYSRYSNFGSTTNSKFGFAWRPIADLLVRGNFSESFRAPSIDNLFGGTSETFDSFTDPCDASFGAGIYGQTVHQACVATLQVPDPENFHQLDPSGLPVTGPDTQTAHPFLSGSNPNLDPETAKTRTLGVVYSPDYVEGLNVSLDWYRIEINDIISSLSADDVLAECYKGNTGFCNRFSRNAQGQVVGLNRSLGNRGRLETDGADLGVLYRMPETDFGRFVLRSTSSYVHKWDEQSDPSVPADSRVGWYSHWKWRNNTTVDWQWRTFGASWTVRYFSGLKENCRYDDECNQPDYVSPVTGATPRRRVGAIAFNDLNLHWDTPWNARISVGANNIFDREPPIMYAAKSLGAPPVNPAYDIDRFWYVSYQQNF